MGSTASNPALDRAHSALQWPSPASRLWALGLASAAIYLFVFTLRFPLPAMYPALVDMGGYTNYEPFAAALYILAGAALLLFYILAWRLAPHLSFNSVRWPLWAGSVLCGTINVFMYPAWAIDIYNYLIRGRIWVRYGENPLVAVPSAFPTDPFMNLAGGWSSHPTPYGPLWVMLSTIPNWLASDNLLLNLLLFKLLAYVSYLGCIALISAILARIAPQYRAAGFALFAWNPLVLLEVAGHGHNDATMMLWALGAVLLVYSSWKITSPLAFVLSALIKYTMVALLPLLFIRLLLTEGRWGRRPLAVMVGCVFATTLAAAIYAPLWAGPEMFEGLRRQNSICIASIGALINSACDRGLLPPVPGLLGDRFPMAVIGIAYLFALSAIWRRPEAWLRAAFEIAFLLVYLLCSFENWYLVWPLALVALLAPGLAAWRMVVFTGTAMLGTAIFGYLWVWLMPAWGFLEIHVLAVPVVLGPPAALAAWEWGRWLFRYSTDRIATPRGPG